MQRAILQNLDRCHPGMMTTTTLWSEVLLDLSSEANYTAFRAAMTELEQKGQIVVIVGEDRTKAKITDAGKARLAEA